MPVRIDFTGRRGCKRSCTASSGCFGPGRTVMHRHLISGFVARPRRHDAEIRQIGKLQALPADQASVPQVNNGAMYSITYVVPKLILSCSRAVSRPRSATRHLLGLSDDDVRSPMGHGHIKACTPTARRFAADGANLMAGQMNGFFRSARPALEKA